MKNTTDSLPAELQAFASPLDSQSPEVQEAFQFLLAAALPSLAPIRSILSPLLLSPQPNHDPSPDARLAWRT